KTLERDRLLQPVHGQNKEHDSQGGDARELETGRKPTSNPASGEEEEFFCPRCCLGFQGKVQRGNQGKQKHSIESHHPRLQNESIVQGRAERKNESSFTPYPKVQKNQKKGERDKGAGQSRQNPNRESGHMGERGPDCVKVLLPVISRDF